MKTKNLTQFLVLVLSLSMFSCSSDSSSDEMPEEQISPLVGNYELTELIANEPSTFNDGTNTPYNMVEELDCFDSNLELKPDMTAVSMGRSILSTYDMDDNLVFSCSAEASSNTVTWEDNGARVEIDNQDFQVNGNRLILERDPNDPMVLYYRVVWVKI